MSPDEIRNELGKLKRRHTIQKWTNLLVGLGLVVGGFAAIAFQEVREFIPDNPGILFPAVGGAILGAVARNWRGSPELRVLEQSIS